MLEFPRQVHNIHKFADNTRIYLADIDQGKVLEIDEVVSDILDLCSCLNRSQIIEKLKEKYDCIHIFKGFERLEALNQMGLIFSPLCQYPPSTEKPNFLITQDHRYKPNLIDVWNNYSLLKSIAPYASLYMGLPLDRKPFTEQIHSENGNFQVQGLPLVDQTGRYAIEEYNGLLVLSSTLLTELPLFRYNYIPVMTRLYSTMGDDLEYLNATLIRYAACRPFDTLVPDSSWFFPLVSDLNMKHTRFCTIPPGINTDSFQSISKQKSKQALARWLNKSNIESRSIVGLVLGTQSLSNRKLPLTLARLHPEIDFLIFEVNKSYKFMDDNLPRNLHYLYLQEFENFDGLSIFLNSLELMIFNITLSSPSSLLLATMACGIPIIAVSNIGMPEELDGTDTLIVQSQNTLKSQIISAEAISKPLKELMSNEHLLTSIGKQVQLKAMSYTWDNTTKQLLSLFKELKHASEDYQQEWPEKQSIIFHQYYDKGTGTTECRATQLPSLTTLSMKEGLAVSLLESGHTLQEIECLLSDLYSPEEAEELLDVFSV